MDNNNEPQFNTGETEAPVANREPQQSDFQPGMQAETTAPPASPPITPPETDEKKKPVGAIFGIIIIIVLLVLAGFYFWGSHLNINALLNSQTATPEMTAEEISAMRLVNALISPVDVPGLHAHMPHEISVKIVLS